MRIITTIAAVLLTSACAGSQLSSAMNDADRERQEAAHFYAFKGTLSQQSVWANAATGIGGTVRAFDEFRDPATDQLCRRFVEHLQGTDGQRQDRTGTSYEKPDGDLVVSFDASAKE
jgi:surface antigen